MPHDFNPAIQAAFDRYGAKRDARVELPPPRFVGGPYFPARVEISQTVDCVCYGEVRVVGWSQGPLPWPQCHIKGPRSLILFEDLARAVEVESADAVAICWGVSRAYTWKWRRILKMQRANAGTAVRLASNVSLVIEQERKALGLERAHSKTNVVASPE